MAFNTFTIQFVLKKEKINKDGLAPIVAKLFINGKKLEISTSRMLEPDFWSVEKRKAKPSFPELEELNIYLESFRAKLYVAYSKVQQQGQEITADSFKEAISPDFFKSGLIYTTNKIPLLL